MKEKLLLIIVLTFCFIQNYGINSEEKSYQLKGELNDEECIPPVVSAGENIEFICNSSFELNATPLSSGNTGRWTVTRGEPTFVVFDNPTIPNTNVLIFAPAGVTEFEFTWTEYVNGNPECFGYDNIIITYAQPRTSIVTDNPVTKCGPTFELSTFQLISGNTGLWTVTSGDASVVEFENPDNPSTNISISAISGVFEFTWNEYVNGNSECFSSDKIVVIYGNPQPNAGDDNSVCGNVAQLSGTLSIAETEDYSSIGAWQMIYENSSGSVQPPTSPSAQATVYPYGIHKFAFIEIFNNLCFSSDTVTIEFVPVPTVVFPVNEEIICGNTVSLVSYDNDNGQWHSTISGNFTPNPNFSSVTFTTEELNVNNREVHATFTRTVYNNSQRDITLTCTNSAELPVTFYYTPMPYAGVDIAMCGNSAELHALFGAPETDEYTPVGIWEVAENPGSGSADFEQNINPVNENKNANVTVSEYGIWKFAFKEILIENPNCYHRDTITVEFVPYPFVSVGEPMYICGDEITLTADESSTDGGQWYTEVPGQFTTSHLLPTSEFIIAGYEYNTVINGIFTRTVFNRNQGVIPITCFATAELSVTFYAKPSVQITNTGNNNIICGNNICDMLVGNTFGNGYTGIWETEHEQITISNQNSREEACFQSTAYGSFDVIWKIYASEYDSDFCFDTAKYTIEFVEQPVTNAGDDVTFCGTTGMISFTPSIGDISWTASPHLIIDSPTSATINVDSEGNFGMIQLTVIEANNNCIDSDVIIVNFLELPSSEVNVIPPRAFGEPAIITARDETLNNYEWDFDNGIVIDSLSQINQSGGNYSNGIYWDNLEETHTISLNTVDINGCISAINAITINEPPIPDYMSMITIVNDSLGLGRGEVIFNVSKSVNVEFTWLNNDVGTISSDGLHITNIPAGKYDIKCIYQSLNYDYYNDYLDLFGSTLCNDIITITIKGKNDVNINKINKDKFVTISPNPATEYINIISDEYDKFDEISIIDINGRTIKTFNNFSENRINISEINSGIYLVRFRVGNDIFIEKIVIQ